VTILRNSDQKTAYELKCLPERFWKLGPMAWLLDFYLGRVQSSADHWIDDGRPVFDKAVADRLGTTEEIIEGWRWFLAHEGLIQQQKLTDGGWLISPSPTWEELLDDWLTAWRRLQYLREALWC
jgi:hypothetical protein